MRNFAMELYVLLAVLVGGIRCMQLGMISPIEVVEEWGCHDTEIRLTCGQLDSKLAILEATFTPNCTHEDCLRMDVKNLVRPFATSQRAADLRVAEKEAGRKFLETLRRKHPDREDGDEDDEAEAGGEESALDEGDDFETSTTSQSVESSSNNPSADRLIALKKRRTSLRTTLERLIIRYLRKLSPGEEFDTQHRGRGSSFRSRRDLSMLGSRNITVNETNLSDSEVSSSEELRRIQETRTFCPEQKRVVTSLGRFDLEQSFRNDSEDEYNIRRVLTKRCSGKNHCSFIFAIDHPFSKVWESGVVRVKYICMDDFRINRYCGEHLNINNEIDPKLQVLQEAKGEPVATARRQSRRETAMHSLKILRAGGDPGNMEQLPVAVGSSSSEGKKRKMKVQASAPPEMPGDDLVKAKDKSRVYSQDFRVLKILPSNLDDFNDIEQIGDEIYFRKDTDILNQEAPPSATTTTTLPTTPQPDGNDDLIIHPSVVMPSPPSGYATDILEATVPDLPPPSPLTPSTDYNITQSLETLENEIEQEGALSSYDDDEDIDDNDNDDGDDDEDADAGDSDETYGLNRRTYNSVQRTSFRSPLLQGFAFTPGYPKFYIGDSECKWMIMAPEGLKVRVSILDLSLRYEENCVDFLRIVDLTANRTMFNSCTEAIRPLEVISESHRIEVIVKTTSRFAYPKRGVLIHYSAIGCVNPPSPKNGRLVERTETTATYECSPSFVFPDTGSSRRQIACSERDSWDQVVPDCIDIVIPTLLIAGLFIVNAVAFSVIMRYRKRHKLSSDDNVELAEL